MPTQRSLGADGDCSSLLQPHKGGSAPRAQVSAQRTGCLPVLCRRQLTLKAPCTSGARRGRLNLKQRQGGCSWSPQKASSRGREQEGGHSLSSSVVLSDPGQHLWVAPDPCRHGLGTALIWVLPGYLYIGPVPPLGPGPGTTLFQICFLS